MELFLSAASMASSPSVPYISFNKFRLNNGLPLLHIACIPRQHAKVPFRKEKNSGGEKLATQISSRVKTLAFIGSLKPKVPLHENNTSKNFSPEMMPDLSTNTSDGVSDLERELQELFYEVKSLLAEGKKDDALNLLEANFEAVKELINKGAKSIEEAALLDIIALGYLAIGDWKSVEYILDKMNEIVDNLSGDDHLLGSVLMHMGSMYSTLGKFNKSVIIYQRAVVILEKIHGENSTVLVTPLLGMAKALGSIGRATKAAELYDRTIAILQLNRGAESEDLVVPLFGLGNLWMKEGRANDAEKQFVRILSIHKKLYGDSDERVGMALSSLAQVKCAKGDVDEAIQLYRNALQIMLDSSSRSLDDDLIEKLRIELAELLHLVGRSNEGRELLEECLLVTEKYKGKDHPDSVTHFINLASSYSGSKNFVEAERLLRTGLEIMMKNVGPDHQSITYPMLHLAVTLYHLKRDEEAEQLAKQVLHIREKAFGKDSLPVGEALDCLISIQARLDKDDGKLLELLERVLKIQEKELGNESEEVMLTMKKMVFCLEKLGRKDEKTQLQNRLSFLRNKFKHRVHY